MKRDWSGPEIRELRWLLRGGVSSVDAAARLGRTPSSVRWAARENNIPLPGRKPKFSAEEWARIDAAIWECLEVRHMPGLRVAQHLRALGFDIGDTRVNKRIHELGRYAVTTMRRNARRALERHLERTRARQTIRARVHKNAYEGINSKSETTKARHKDGPSPGRKVLQAP